MVVVLQLAMAEQVVVVLEMKVSEWVVVQQLAMDVLVIVLQSQVDGRQDMVCRVVQVQLVRQIILKNEWMAE